MNNVTSSPLFGIFLSIVSFAVGIWFNKKTKSPLASPLIICTAIIIAVLKIFHIPFDDYNKGGSVIVMFLIPATASLALPIYKNLHILKKNLFPVLAGTGAGSLASVLSIKAMCIAFKMDGVFTASMIPKSVTTPIAIELSQQNEGLAPITIAAVVATGILGAMIAPILLKTFKFNNDISAGTAIGTSSHAAGTSKAIELGETIGAMSGISIALSGLFTVLYLMFF